MMRRVRPAIIRGVVAFPLAMVLLLVAPSWAMAAETVELQKLSGGDSPVPGVAVQVTGSGFGYYGDSIRVTFDNQTGETVFVRVPLGLQLHPADESVQTMITAGNERIEVPPGSSTAVIKAFCGEASDGAPGASDVFTPGELVAGDLMGTVRTINRNEAYDSSGQHAVWHHTDDYDLSGDDAAVRLTEGGGASAGAAAAAGAAATAAVGGTIAATNIIARPPGPVRSGSGPSGTLILGSTDAINHLTAGGATTIEIGGETYVLPLDALPPNTNGAAYETVIVNGIEVIDPNQIAIIPGPAAPAGPGVIPPSAPAQAPSLVPDDESDAGGTPGSTGADAAGTSPEGKTPPEESTPPEGEKPPGESEPVVVAPPGPVLPPPGDSEVPPADTGPGDGLPEAPGGHPDETPPADADPESGPATPPGDTKISEQEVDDIVKWGIKNNRTPEDIQVDIDARNETLGGSGSVPVTQMPVRVTLPQGEVTVTAAEAQAYEKLRQDVTDMRSDAEYVKDHLKQLEAESRKWAALEQNVEGRAVAGIGDLYEDAKTYNDALDDSFADRFGRPGKFSWDTRTFDTHEQAVAAWEQTEEYQRYLETRREAVHGFVTKVNEKVSSDPQGRTSWLNRPLKELKKIEAEQQRAIDILRRVRGEAAKLAEMERKLAERIQG